MFDAATGELLGAHMVGAEVTELIQGYAVARQLETTEAELMHTVFPHPTLSEMMHESVLDAYGRAHALLRLSAPVALCFTQSTKGPKALRQRLGRAWPIETVERRSRSS